MSSSDAALMRQAHAHILVVGSNTWLSPDWCFFRGENQSLGATKPRIPFRSKYAEPLVNNYIGWKSFATEFL